MTRYVVYDVFTDKPFGGNPLAIFLDATGLDTDQLQAIAREFNFSETTFVFPPDDPAHTAKVRIFTPTQEIPFAGHPTIGTAIALHDAGRQADMVLELGVGPLACRVDNGRAQFTTHAPLQVLAQPDPALIARALRLTKQDFKAEVHPPTHASLGLPFVIVELTDSNALARCQTDIAAFREGQDRYPCDMDFAVFAYARDGAAIQARMFAPLDNIPEDPATGSACATLGALLQNVTGADQTLLIHQGVDMGRPSVIHVQAAQGAVTVLGTAVKIMEGQLVL